MKSFTKEEIASILQRFPDDNKRKAHVQELVFDAWRVANCRGSFEGATGVGKTRVGVLAILKAFSINENANVWVGTPTESLRDIEWPDELRKWGAEHLISKVHFICHTSMHEVDDPQDVDLFIFDEDHHITEKNYQFFTKRKVYQILGLSATLPTMKEDQVKRTMLDKLCPVFFTITLEDGIALNLVTDFEIVILKFKLDSVHLMIKGGTEKMPTVTTEAAHYKHLTTQIAKLMRYASNPNARFAIISRRLDLILNLPTKKQIAKEVMEQIIKEDTRTLIFCGSIEQCEELCAPNTFHSQTNGKALRAFKDKDTHYLGAVKALNEGKNIPDVDQSLIVQLSSKARDMIQRIGRNIRWRKNHIGRIIILVAEGTVDEKWAKEALKNFNPSRIKTHIIKPANLDYAINPQFRN